MVPPSAIARECLSELGCAGKHPWTRVSATRAASELNRTPRFLPVPHFRKKKTVTSLGFAGEHQMTEIKRSSATTSKREFAAVSSVSATVLAEDSMSFRECYVGDDAMLLKAGTPSRACIVGSPVQIAVTARQFQIADPRFSNYRRPFAIDVF